MTAPTPSTDSGTTEVLLDVRPIIERGEEPFGTIMETVASLDGRALVLVAPFEPTPLQGVLSAQGFTYESEQVGEAEWRVRFEPAGGAPGTSPPTATSEADTDEAAVTDTTATTDTDTIGATTTGSPVAEPVSPYTIKRPATATTEPSPAPRSEAPAPVPPASVMAMDPTLNVPPAWLPLGFMAAAGVGLVGLGTALAIAAPSVVTAPRTDNVIATVHLAVLAFLSTAVLGALHQFGPVVGGRPLRSIPAGAITGVLFVAGVWLIPIGFALGLDPVVQIGGVTATVAVCIAAWNVSRPLSATGKGVPIVGLRLAVTYLVVTAAFGITYAFDRSHFWFPLLDHRVLAHAHIGLLGWLGLAYVAVAEKLWPMFLLAHRPHAREGERAVWFLGIGAPLLVVGLLFSWEPLAIIGGAYVVPGLLFHLGSLASVIRHRRRSLELLHGFVLTSAGCLVVAIATAVTADLADLAPGTRSRLVVTEVTALILWLTLAVVGHAHKIVPFISWNRLRGRGITTGRDGTPLLFAHLVEPTAARVTFALAAAGALTGLIGSLSATGWLLRASGIALGLAAIVAIANLASGPLSMIRWHDRNNTPTRTEELRHVAHE